MIRDSEITDWGGMPTALRGHVAANHAHTKPWAWHPAMAILVAAALLAGCQSQKEKPPEQPAILDLDAELTRAKEAKQPLTILIAERGNDASIFELTVQQAAKDGILFQMLDIGYSRNRATATRFHITETPLLVCLSPRGVIVSRNEPPLMKELVLKRFAELVEQSPQLDAKLTALDAAVAKNPADAAAQLQLADFLLEQQNAHEAIPHLAAVVHTEANDASLRVKAWVELARAHLWIAEPEKGRHEAQNLIATLGAKIPEARAGGNLVMGMQDATGKRFALARREFNEAIAAAPKSNYAQEAAEALAKLPPEEH